MCDLTGGLIDELVGLGLIGELVGGIMDIILAIMDATQPDPVTTEIRAIQTDVDIQFNKIHEEIQAKALLLHWISQLSNQICLGHPAD